MLNPEVTTGGFDGEAYHFPDPETNPAGFNAEMENTKRLFEAEAKKTGNSDYKKIAQMAKRMKTIDDNRIEELSKKIAKS